jgi:DNA-binding GntR family transcriptional regulator
LPTTGFLQSLASIDDLVQFGATHTRQVLHAGEVVTDAALAQLLGCTVGTRWLRISSLRLQKAQAPSSVPVPVQPIGLTDVYVTPGHEGLVERVRASPDVLVSTLLETGYGQHIAEVTQDLRALSLPPAVAGGLGVESGSAGLRMVRRYLGQAGQIVEISVTHHPAERFTLRTRLVRAAG